MYDRNMVFDFTHTYPEEMRAGNEFIWFDCSDIEESRLYCSDKAEAELKELIEPYGISGIHFIDSGDYHYISRYMTEFIKESFSLVLFDHHTDMQKPLIAGMTSCGSWAGEVLEGNEYLEQLVLIGPRQRILNSLEVKNKEKLVGISFEEVAEGKAKDRLESIRMDVPAYLSIDKDVLRQQSARTNWDQGDMSVSTLEQLLRFLMTEMEIIGIDICGEYPEEGNLPEFLEAQRINNKLNMELYSYISELLKKREY